MSVRRIRAKLEWTSGSGTAAWAQAQNSVRHAQAVSIHPGAQNAELRRNDVRPDGTYEVDLAFPAGLGELAEDTFNTLTAPSLVDPSILRTPHVGDREFSFVEVHTCYHDETPQQPCSPPDLIWNNQPSPDSGEQPAPWIQPTGDPATYYNTGDQVLYNDTIYESLIDANVWSPDAYPAGWTEVTV